MKFFYRKTSSGMKIEGCEKRGRRLECNLKIGVREEKDEKLRLSDSNVRHFLPFFRVLSSLKAPNK